MNIVTFGDLLPVILDILFFLDTYCMSVIHVVTSATPFYISCVITKWNSQNFSELWPLDGRNCQCKAWHRYWTFVVRMHFLFEKIDQSDRICRLHVNHCGNISQKSQKIQVMPLPLDVSVVLHSLVNSWPTSYWCNVLTSDVKETYWRARSQHD